jgi:hypothetical protein
VSGKGCNALAYSTVNEKSSKTSAYAKANKQYYIIETKLLEQTPNNDSNAVFGAGSNNDSNAVFGAGSNNGSSAVFGAGSSSYGCCQFQNSTYLG